jgi:thioester reductase-like protein
MTRTNDDLTSGLVPLPIDARVLLTGATGFLGSHLLFELLERSSASVSCLVRGDGPAGARRNLLARLGWYFPEVDWHRHERRLSIVPGNVEEKRLGLDEATYEELARSHTLVLNAAANVSQSGSASSFFRANTDAVAVLLEFARHGTPKQFHQVSTIDVRGQFSTPTSLMSFAERHLDEGQTFNGAYAESKYRAEVLVRQAFAAGLTGSVYRVGYVAPHDRTGRFQQNIHQNHIARYVRGCICLGFAPYAPSRTLRPTPVDGVARAITTLVSAGAKGQTYYVQTPHEVSQYDVVRVLHAVGYPIRLMSLEDFEEKAPRLSRDEESFLAMLPGHGGGGRVLPTDSNASQRELARLGFEYPRPTSRWLAQFIRHAIEVGFVEAPRFWSSAPLVPDLL